MTFVLDDGGRAAAGFKGDARDCVCRAVAIATQRPYAEVYQELAAIEGGRRRSKRRPNGRAASARNGIKVQTVAFKRYMEGQGFRWVSTMGIGTGCQVHLDPRELPKGRLVVHVSRHSVAVIDGVIRDTFDASRGGKRCVYGYWMLAQ